MTRPAGLRRLLGRWVAAGVMAPGLLLAMSTVPGSSALPGGATCAAAGYQHHATVVVTHLHVAPSPVRVCVGFDETQITGHQLLDRSGIEWGGSSYYGGQGTAVCQVDNEPSQYPPDCLQSGSPYWSIWLAHYGQPWALTSFGIDAVTVRDGDSEGFRYADGNGQGPPDSPGGVCPPPAPASPSPSPPRSTSNPPPAAPASTGGQPAGIAPAPGTAPGTPAGAAPTPGVSPGSPAGTPATAGASAEATASPPTRGRDAPGSKPPPGGSGVVGWLLASTAAVAMLGTIAAQVAGRPRA